MPRQKGLPCVTLPDSKVHGANLGPIWVLSAPDGPHVGPRNLAISASLAAYHRWSRRCIDTPGPLLPTRRELMDGSLISGLGPSRIHEHPRNHCNHPIYNKNHVIQITPMVQLTDIVSALNNVQMRFRLSNWFPLHCMALYMNHFSPLLGSWS